MRESQQSSRTQGFPDNIFDYQKLERVATGSKIAKFRANIDYEGMAFSPTLVFEATTLSRYNKLVSYIENEVKVGFAVVCTEPARTVYNDQDSEAARPRLTDLREDDSGQLAEATGHGITFEVLLPVGSANGPSVVAERQLRELKVVTERHLRGLKIVYSFNGSSLQIPKGRHHTWRSNTGMRTTFTFEKKGGWGRAHIIRGGVRGELIDRVPTKLARNLHPSKFAWGPRDYARRNITVKAIYGSVEYTMVGICDLI